MSPIDDLAGRPRRRRSIEQSRPIVEEDVEERIAETARMFVNATAEDDAAMRDAERSHARQEIEEETFRLMRGYVGDELTIVSKLEGPDGIATEERERQIARRALAKLTKIELQAAAASLGLPRSGTKEDLLDRLVLYLDGDRAAVSTLISATDRHTREGRRHAARLFPFEDLPRSAALAEVLAPYARRYVRTDVASWFVLADVESDEAGLNVGGHFRTYDVSIDPETLREHEHDWDVSLHVRDRQSILRAYARHEAETVAAVEAFSFLAGQPPLPPLALVSRQRPVWGSAVNLSVQTTWLIGLLLSLLEHPEMTLRDVTSATFERPVGDRAAAVAPEVPHVGSARLRGQHVLDSQSACRHVTSGERLRAVTAILRFQSGDAAAVNVPVRFAVESTHIGVMTGFGGLGAGATRPFHQMLEDYVAEHLLGPAFDASEVQRVVSEMLLRASEREAPRVADLFARLDKGQIRVEQGA